ncbi:hypothetical protein QPM16_01160 [Streptomyces anulatus]|nr:hypothetical protein [Streptomyces anulatus]WIY81369.1 hypothetical protein QPM16_01160 [Streptomyces anulatus]
MYASTFDRPAREHIALAELAVERGRRLVEVRSDRVRRTPDNASFLRQVQPTVPDA